MPVRVKLFCGTIVPFASVLVPLNTAPFNKEIIPVVIMSPVYIAALIVIVAPSKSKACAAVASMFTLCAPAFSMPPSSVTINSSPAL